MRAVTVTQSGVGSSQIIPLDHFISPFNVGFGVKVSAGASLLYTMQHTFDDVLAVDYDSAATTWYDHPSVFDQDINQDGNYAFPVTAIRVTVLSGTGDVTLTAIQAGSGN